jgi:hypothetical protein
MSDTHITIKISGLVDDSNGKQRTNINVKTVEVIEKITKELNTIDFSGFLFEFSISKK